tara:strand:+ start:4223 stop:4714 length:492 start_codon:yes stop_codon:yes gene_type:complete
MTASAAIRPAAAEDQDAVGALINGIQRGEFAIDITLADQPDLADISGFYRKGAGDFWIADAGGEIAGTIALIDIGGGLGALRKMFVAPAFRGREHGIAKKLLDVLLDHARARGLAAVYLGTTAKFLAAHRFYEKNGFDLIDEADLPAGFPRMAVDTRFYRITL